MKKITDKSTKRITRKAKKIRSIVMMILLCILLLSSATYAWFTLSDTAKVTNLTMTVSEVEGLRVAKDKGTNNIAESEWSGMVQLDTIVGQLMPATSSNGTTFSKPVYNEEGQVVSVEATTDKLTKDNKDTNKTGHYYETTFYMQSLGEDANIKLVKGQNLSNNTTRKGTYVVVTDKKDSKSQNNAAAAIRISLTTEGSKTQTAIYEPYCDVNETGTSAELNGHTPNVVASTAKQTSNGTFSSNAEYSPILFKLSKDVATKITIRIWIEGNDAQCVNQIQLEELLGQLQFIKDESASN